jgi:hypothetical protein
VPLLLLAVAAANRSETPLASEPTSRSTSVV